MKKIIIMITTLFVASLSPNFASAEIHFNTKLTLSNHINVVAENSVEDSQCFIDIKNLHGENYGDDDYINHCNNMTIFSENHNSICSFIKSDILNNSAELNDSRYLCHDNSVYYTFQDDTLRFRGWQNIFIGDSKNELSSKFLIELVKVGYSQVSVEAPRF